MCQNLQVFKLSNFDGKSLVNGQTFQLWRKKLANDQTFQLKKLANNQTFKLFLWNLEVRIFQVKKSWGLCWPIFRLQKISEIVLTDFSTSKNLGDCNTTRQRQNARFLDLQKSVHETPRFLGLQKSVNEAPRFFAFKNRSTKIYCPSKSVNEDDSTTVPLAPDVTHPCSGTRFVGWVYFPFIISCFYLHFFLNFFLFYFLNENMC